ncbi:MAG: hypothetical protein U9N61_08115 [Euryarchaeota archaeon]|nr:hypothetical protein [Euryarchaeota archaeon]
MRLLGIILVSLFICLSVIAQDVIQDIRISDPGSGGMVTNVGMGELQPNQLRYSMNVDVTRWPGRIRPRLPLRNYGGNDRLLYGAYGYYDPYTERKVVVGISDSSYVYYLYPSTDSTVGVVSLVGQFFCSDTFATTVSNGVAGLVLPYQSGYHDWTTHKNLLVHCDGKNLPNIFTTSDGSEYLSNAPDTSIYKPRSISIGLEAPGQIRAGVMDIAGNLDGKYRYSYAFYNAENAADSASLSNMAIPSATIYPDDEIAYLTGFENYESPETYSKLILRQKMDGRGIWNVIDTLPPITMDSVGASWIRELWTRYLSGSTGNEYFDYYANGSVGLYLWWSDSADHSFYVSAPTGVNLVDRYVDTVFNDWVDAIDTSSLIANRVKGVRVGDIGFSIVTTPVGDSDFCFLDSVVTYHASVAYWGYYPSTETECAGPDSTGTRFPVYVDTLSDSLVMSDSAYLWSEHADNVTDTIYRPGQLHLGSLKGQAVDTGSYNQRAYDDSSYAIAYSFYDPTTGIESPLGPLLYTTLTDTIHDGSDDSCLIRSVTTGCPREGRQGWIRLYQGIKATTSYGGGDTTIWYGLYQMRLSDTGATILWGQWTDAQVVLGLDTAKIYVDTIYDHQVFYGTVLGDPVVFPPYIYDNQIPFSDIEKYGSRFYGIGDPENSSAIYWSGHDTVWNWNPYNYFLLDSDVNDELVALEKTTQSLFALKHNSIWRLGGSDPQYSMSVDKMTDAVGAVSRETVVKRGDDIYFLSPALDVYKLNDGGLAMISQPVRDQIADTLFDITYATAGSYGRLYMLGDDLIVQNDNTAEMIGYNLESGTWGYLDMDAGYIPLGTFRYDSTEGSSGFGYYTDMMYMDSAIPFVSQKRVSTDATANEYRDWIIDVPVPSDGKSYMQVTQISGMAISRTSGSQKLRYIIFDGSVNIGKTWGDSLVADSITLTAPDALGEGQRHFVLDVEPHEPSLFPYVRLFMERDTSESVAVNTLEIEDLTFSVRYMGRVAAE